MSKKSEKNLIVEKKLGIPPNYQYQAIRSKNFLQSNWHKNKLIALSSLLNFSKEKRILDLGTGSGNLEITFATQVKEIIGVDYNDEAIKFLQGQLGIRKIKNVRLFIKDIRNLHSIKKLGRFDIIVIMDVIEHIKISEAEKVIENLHYFLKPNGKICIITPNYFSPWIIIERIIERLTSIPKLKGEQHLAKYHFKNLTNLLSKYGFKTEKLSSFNLLSFLSPNSFLARLLTKIEILTPFPLGNLLIGIFSCNNFSQKTHV